LIFDTQFSDDFKLARLQSVEQ